MNGTLNVLNFLYLKKGSDDIGHLKDVGLK